MTSAMRCRRPFLALGLLALGVATASGADALLEKLPAEALADPAARAPALAALDPAGLDDVTRRRWRLLLAEAWLDAGEPAKAAAAATAVAQDATTPAADRDRAGLTWIAAWQALPPADRGDAVDGLKRLGVFGATVQARALTARALSRADQPAALEDLDAALALLKTAEPGERTPLYTLRLTMMEDQGAKPKDSAAWLARFADDPGAPLVRSAELPAAPALVGPRVDPGRDQAKPTFDLLSLRNTPVIVAFVASWDAPSQAVPPLLAAAVAGHPEVRTVVVALDGADSVGDLPAWIAKMKITGPVVADGQGWDGDLDDQWRVTTLPRLFLVNPDGKVVAADLWAGADTAARLAAALSGRAPEAPASTPAPTPGPAKTPASAASAAPGPAASEVP